MTWYAAALLAVLGSVTGAAAEDLAGTPAPCCPGVVRKACVPVPDTKKTTKTVYECKEEDICLPRCSFLSLLHGLTHRCGCDCPECGKPRTKRVLIKKFVTEETPTVKCVPEKAGPCDPRRP